MICVPKIGQPPPKHKEKCACPRCTHVFHPKGESYPEELRKLISLIKKGQVPANKGKHHTAEAKRRISLALKGKKFSEERLRKMRIVYKTRKSWNKGKHWSEEVKRKISEGNKGNKPNLTEEQLRKAALLGAQTRYIKNSTPVEQALYDYLLLKGIIFEKQKIIGDRMVVDVYIPFLNLVIEADGKYHKQKRTKEKDIEKEKYLKANGIKILRLTDEEIKSGKFKERLVF